MHIQTQSATQQTLRQPTGKISHNSVLKPPFPSLALSHTQMNECAQVVRLVLLYCFFLGFLQQAELLFTYEDFSFNKFIQVQPAAIFCHECLLFILSGFLLNIYFSTPDFTKYVHSSFSGLLKRQVIFSVKQVIF